MYFLDLDNKFRNSLYLRYPELKDHKLEEFIKTLQKSELENIKEEAQISWNGIEENILKEFSNILEKEWKLETVPGGISLIPFSTRDLKKRRFDVYYKKDIQSILKTTTHDLFHFIFFDKWIDIFPNTTRDEMDYHNPVWALSEIVLPTMLDNTKIKNILGIEFNNYPMFVKEMFEGENVVLHIQNSYRHNTLDDFLKASYEYISKYYDFRNSKKEQGILSSMPESVAPIIYSKLLTKFTINGNSLYG